MRLFRFCAVFAVCMVSVAHAQFVSVYDTVRYPQTYLFDFKGDGARAAGMGNAFMAVSDDISAGSWNPAGLYTGELVTFSLSLVNFRPGGSGWGNMNPLDPSESNRALFDISDAFTGDVQQVRVMAPVRIKGHPFVFSFGNNRTFDDYQQTAFKSTFNQLFVWPIGTQVYFDTNRLDLNIESKTFTKINAVNIAFGTRLFGPLSGGLALNVFGGRSFRYEKQSAFVYDLRWPTLNSYQFTDFSRDVEHYDTTRFSGYNVTVGFKFAQPRWNGALVIKTPFSMNAKLDSLRYTITSTVNEYGQYFTIDNGTDSIMVPRSLTKYDIPMSITLGGSYNVNENTLVSGDLEYRGWEGKTVRVRVDEKLNPGSDSKEEFIELDPHWQNVVSLRVGAEHFLQTGLGRIPLRVGFGSIGLPQPDAMLAIDVDTAGNATPIVSYSSKRMTTLSAGVGLHWSQIKLDVAFVRSAYDHATYRDLGKDLSQNRDIVVGAGNVETKVRTNSLYFTFTGVF